MTVGFVGLGVMGSPMACHLAKANVSTVVWNRTSSKTEAAQKIGAAVAGSLADLAARCDLIFTCVSRTEDLEDCLAELLTSAKPGTLFVDHSTISPEGTLKIHADLKSKGFRFLDAPITGGSMGANNGTLTIFCGGEKEDYELALPFMNHYAKRAELVGPAGAGAMMKMVNQIAVGGALIGLCESLAFAKKAGLDISLARDIVGSGAAGSWAFENYGPKIINNDWSPGFAINHQVKDFQYCLEAAESLRMELPGTQTVNELLKLLQDQGKGEETTAALYKILAGEASK